MTLFIKKQIQCGFDNTIDFVAEGIYNYSRNPDYISLLFILTGTALMSLNALALLAPLSFYYLSNHWFIPKEEEEMIRDYGADYADFRNKVKRWI
jgi:protein-S-isoprenylcysteine O-methyltransferase Ste14